MGNFGFEFNDIYYKNLKNEKQSFLCLSKCVVEDVSLYLNENYEKILVDLLNLDASSIKTSEEKIANIFSLKQKMLTELATIRSDYKHIYYKVKNCKSLNQEEVQKIEDLRKLKHSFVSYVKFLDKVLHQENKGLVSLIRKRNISNHVDMKTSIILDDKSKFVYDKMVNGESFYETNIHSCLCALSYYIKFINLSNIHDSRILKYVDYIMNRLEDNSYDYFQNIIDVNLLKQVAKQKANTIDKDDKLTKKFFNSIVKRIQMLEEKNIMYDTSDFDDVDICNSFYKALEYEKNINVVRSFLNQRPDLVYMQSNVNYSKYYLIDIIDKYGNLLLNVKENHEDLEYYRSLVRLYIDTINTLDNKDISLVVLRRIQSIIRNVNNSQFGLRRKEACLFEIGECIDKLGNSPKKDNLLEFMDSCYYKRNKVDAIFSIDCNGTKMFEQAYSYSEENGYKYLTFYISDTTNNLSLDSDSIENFVYVGNNNNLFSRKKKRDLSLDALKESNVIAYHFILDSSNNVKDLDINKEKIMVAKNFFFDDFSFILEDSNNAYFKTVSDLINLVQSFDITCDREQPLDELVRKLSIFFQRELGKYCDNNGIPYISKFVYTKDDIKDGLIKNVFDNLECNNLSTEQILNAVEASYLSGIYTVTKSENMNFERRAKVTSPCRDLASFINQMVIYHYFVNGNDISYREDLKTRRDLRLLTDEMNKQLLESKMKVEKASENKLKQKIKGQNQKIKYNIKVASEN